jgi:uncharacterized protein DUF4154
MPPKSSRFSIFFFLLSYLISTTFSFSGSAFAEESVNREFTIKAGLLLKFTNFIQWPETYSSIDREEPLNICIFGKNKFGDILDYVNDHDILRRDILVRYHVPKPELNTCHIIYIGSIEITDLDDFNDKIKTSPVLVITESEKISHPLVAINFRKVNNKMRFEINRSAFERSGIMINSELLNLAIKVVRIE